MNYKVRPAWARYGVAVGCVVLGWLAREALTTAIGPAALPFIFFFPAVAVAAWYGGFAAGTFATIVSAAAADWFFINPIHSWPPTGLGDVAAIGAFLLSCAVIVGAMAAMHRARAGALAELTARKQTEESLRSSEARLRAFLDNSAIIAWLKDEQGRNVFLSDNYVRCFGLKDWKNKTDFELWPRAAAESFRKTDLIVLSGDSPFECVEEARISDGNVSHWLNSKFWFQDASGKKYVGGVGVDVTKRKHAEEASRRSEAKLSEELRAMSRLQELSAHLVQQGELNPLLQAILSASADITGTDKGNIQIYDPNTRMLRILVHQGLGRRLVEHFAEDGWVATCAEAASKVERVIVEDVEKLEHLRGTVELEIVLEDGIRSIQSTPLVSRDGRLLGMLNNHYCVPGRPDDQKLRYIDLLARQAADLIERDRAEVLLRESEQRFRQLMALLPVGVYTINAPNGEITYYNDQAAVLWGRRPAPGDTQERWCGSFRLWMPDGSSLPHDSTPMTQVLAEGRCFRNLQVVIERPPPDSSRITVLVNIDPVLDQAGRVVGAINVFHDVTALRETEEALREALKAKDHFLASISHELRTPLTPVLMMTDILQRNKILPQSVKSGLDVIGRNVQLEARLVDDLLDISRVTTGKLRVELSECDVHEIVERAVRVCFAPDNGDRLNVVTKLNAMHRNVSGDATRLQQVFWNLIQNAIKFTSPGGSIIISSRNENGQLCVGVSDTGCGIEPAKLERIFEPFTNLNPAMGGTRGQRGLGLGLAIARQIIVAHGGALVATSDGVNHGATFTVSLPASPNVTDLPPLPDERPAKTEQALPTNAQSQPSSS